MIKRVEAHVVAFSLSQAELMEILRIRFEDLDDMLTAMHGASVHHAVSIEEDGTIHITAEQVLEDDAI